MLTYPCDYYYASFFQNFLLRNKIYSCLSLYVLILMFHFCFFMEVRTMNLCYSFHDSILMSGAYGSKGTKLKFL
jgi:hypothetical protein